MRRLAVFAISVTVACVSQAPCTPVVGPGCRYQITLRDSAGKILGVLRSQLYNPCLTTAASDTLYPGWPVARDTIAACPP